MPHYWPRLYGLYSTVTRLSQPHETAICSHTDIGLGPLNQIDSIVVGNCAMYAWNQANIRGQVLMTPFKTRACFARNPIVNGKRVVQQGLGISHCMSHILSGMSELSLAWD